MEGKMSTRERSQLFVGLIDIMFGVVLAQSLIFQTSSSGVPSWASNLQQNFIPLGDALLAYTLVVTSWIGYHESVKELPIKNVGRFIIDILLLFFYYEAFINISSFRNTTIIIAIVFFLYLAWTSIRLHEYGLRRDLIIRSAVTGFFSISFLLIALGSIYFPDSTSEGVLLILAFIFLILYRVRYKTWARIRARITGGTTSGTNSDTKITHGLKIYIAGPYTPSNSDIHDAARVANKNTMEAIHAGIAVIKRGHIPFIPHLTHFIHLETDEPLPVNFYYEYDKVWLNCCDALLFLGESTGANEELALAKEKNLMIFRALEEIPIINAR